MTTDQVILQIIQWWGVVCLLASLLLSVLPTPREIRARWYLIVYNVVRRLSMNRAWKDRTEKPKGE